MLSAVVIYGSLFLYAFQIFLSLSVSSLCVANRNLTLPLLASAGVEIIPMAFLILLTIWLSYAVQRYLCFK